MDHRPIHILDRTAVFQYRSVFSDKLAFEEAISEHYNHGVYHLCYYVTGHVHTVIHVNGAVESK